MFNDKVPYIVLDENFQIIYAHEKIKKDYSGLLLPDFFRNILNGYSCDDFEMPVELDAGLGDIRDTRLIFLKDDKTVKCWPVKSKIYGDNRVKNIHYGLREPISSIFAMLPVITDNINKTDNDKAISNLEMVNVQSYKLLKNVNNISLAARILAGELPGTDVLNLSSLTENLVMAVKAVEKNVSINCNADSNVFIQANKGLITNAVLNLIANSINFKADEDVVINISLKKEADKAVFTFSDNSKGIKDEYLPFIFKPYYSKDPFADGESDPSLGLGLFIVKTAFEAAGGKILTSSVFGKGVKYIITLPLAEDNGNIMESMFSEFLLNRYSELFVQLCDSCQLPSLK